MLRFKKYICIVFCRHIVFHEWIELNRVRNEEVCKRGGLEGSWRVECTTQRVLRWFGHVERTDEYRMNRWVLMAEESGARVRGRPRLGLMDVVKAAWGRRGLTLEAKHNARKI